MVSLPCLILLLAVPLVSSDIMRTDELGPYFTNLTSASVCSGQYKKSLGLTEFKVVNLKNGTQFAFGNFTLLQDIKRPQQLIRVAKKTKKGYVNYLNQVVDNLCDCPICVKKLYSFAADFKTIDKECNIAKGSKTFYISPDEWMHHYTGHIVLYVDIRFRMEFYIKNHNLFCIVGTISFQKIAKA